MELTRRHALAGAVATVASPLVAPFAAQASAPAAGKQAASFYRYKVGDIEVTAVSDGTNNFALPDTFVTNKTKADVNAALEKAFMPADKMSVPFAPVVLNSGGKLIAIDTGNGPAAFASSKGNVGQYQTNLAAAGIDPKSIDMVVISHFHGDHVNGLLNAEGQAVFPNAEVLVSSTEWKFWMDDGEMSRAPEGRMQDLFKNARRVFDAGLKKKVTPFEWGKDIAPGLMSVAAPGHTPGHTAFVVSSGSDKVFIQSDTTNHPALFAANPGWHLVFDQDAAMAEATRRKIYDMLSAEKMRVQGYHFPFPAQGNVAKDGDGYRYVPVMWSSSL